MCYQTLLIQTHCFFLIIQKDINSFTHMHVLFYSVVTFHVSQALSNSHEIPVE